MTDFLPPRNYWKKLFIVIACVMTTGLILLSLIEPMRFVLPKRYLFTDLDIARTGGLDYTLCMKVSLSEEEVRAFIGTRFPPEFQGVRQSVVESEPQCVNAVFWPEVFSTQTIAYRRFLWPENKGVEGTQGAVYENGFLYYWSNTS